MASKLPEGLGRQQRAINCADITRLQISQCLLRESGVRPFAQIAQGKPPHSKLRSGADYFFATR